MVDCLHGLGAKLPAAAIGGDENDEKAEELQGGSRMLPSCGSYASRQIFAETAKRRDGSISKCT